MSPLGSAIAAGTVIRANPRAVYRRLVEGAGGVLLHLDTAAYYGLNEVASVIWTLLEGGVTFQGLVDELAGRIEDPPPTLRDEVAALLLALRERDLAVFAERDTDAV